MKLKLDNYTCNKFYLKDFFLTNMLAFISGKIEWNFIAKNYLKDLQDCIAYNTFANRKISSFKLYKERCQSGNGADC